MRVKNQREFVEQLARWFKAGVPAVHVVAGSQTALAERLIAEAFVSVKAVGSEGERNVVTWDCVQGLYNRAKRKTVSNTASLTRAVAAVVGVGQAEDPSVKAALGTDACVVFRDPHFFLRQMPADLSSLKEAIKSNGFSRHEDGSSGIVYYRTAVLLTNATSLTEELNGYVSVLELPLPVREEIEPIINNLMKGWPSHIAAKYAAGTPGRDMVCRASVGLGQMEIENVLSEAVVRHRDDLDKVRGTIERQKADVLKRSEVLTYEPLEDVMSAPELRGYEAMDAWVSARKVAYSPRADELGLDRPKGIGLVGIPGGGKSVSARCIARTLDLPLVWFDVSAVFGSLVGESERRMRDALAAVEAIEECVLVVDEIDKAMGGAHSSGGDSGVTRRVLGTLLSWMANKASKVFVVFTMNRIEQLPPELLRRGRLDEIFAVDLPDGPTRREILELHMRRRRVDPAAYSEESWAKFEKMTDEFVGAELEEVVKAARLEALVADPSGLAVPTASQLEAVIARVVPLAKSDADEVNRIREFAGKRAVPVGRIRQPTGKKTRNGGGVRTIVIDATDRPQNN